MIGGPVAGRYAAALYDIASEQKNMVDKIESELKAIKGIIEDNPDLQRLL
jgi:F0F1-type ATP synthase delta subunit